MAPYICNICHKSFNSNQHLKQHKNKKNPCYNSVTASIPLTTSNSLQDALSIENPLQNKYLSDFIVTYQTLLRERDLINKTVEDYKNQKNELLVENKCLKKKLKAICQIISQPNTQSGDEESKESNTVV